MSTYEEDYGTDVRLSIQSSVQPYIFIQPVLIGLAARPSLFRDGSAVRESFTTARPSWRPARHDGSADRTSTSSSSSACPTSLVIVLFFVN
jgi:hypothetical protein